MLFVIKKQSSKFCDKLCKSNHIKRERLKNNKPDFLKEKKQVKTKSFKTTQKIENQRLYYEKSWEENLTCGDKYERARNLFRFPVIDRKRLKGFIAF